MQDLREEFLNKTLLKLDEAGIKDIDTIRFIIVKTIGEYEITERCTEVATLDDTNEAIIKMFLAAKKIEGGSDETARNRWYILRKFNDGIKKPLTQVSYIDLLNWLMDLQKRVSLSSAENYRNTLSSLFHWMQKNKIITDNPMENIKPIKHPEAIKTSFNSVEIDSMRSACKKPVQRAILELLLSSGLRCEELCDLKWNDVNFVTKDITVVEGKGRKNRVTMMDDVTRKYLLEHKGKLKHNSEYVFASTYDDVVGKKTTNAVWGMLKRIAEKAGVEHVNPHRFRHTFATTLYKRGLDVRMIQKLLGHSNINTTMIYIDSDIEMLRDAYKKCV